MRLAAPAMGAFQGSVMRVVLCHALVSIERFATLGAFVLVIGHGILLFFPDIQRQRHDPARVANRFSNSPPIATSPTRNSEERLCKPRAIGFSRDRRLECNSVLFMTLNLPGQPEKSRSSEAWHNTCKVSLSRD